MAAECNVYIENREFSIYVIQTFTAEKPPRPIPCADTDPKI